jgi:alpha-N-arabinofuranosidase
MCNLVRFLSCCLLVASGLLAQQVATIHVDAHRVENHVSPRMYAGFVEMMAEDVKRGLTAEMLLDRSFEQAPDYLGLPAHWQLEPDERNDIVGAIKFKPVTGDAYPRLDAATHTPNHSLQVTLAPGDITDSRRGLSQGRLSVIAGQPYTAYLWAKVPATGGYAGHIRVALEQDVTDGESYADAVFSGVSGDWRQFRFTLTPTKTDRFSKLSILFDGHGTLLLDQLSLEPGAARREVRSDTEAMVATLPLSFLRWPGGNVAQDYHWQWGIGPRDLRPVWVNKSWSNAPEPDDLGTDEYLAMCERLHIEPSITVNVDGDGATPAEAAAWVQYVNGPATSKYGMLRATNGHPAPYNVKQWELGNEIFGGWVRGHVTAEQYATAAVQYANAMRGVDPTLRLIAVGEGIFTGSDAWNSAVLRIAGSQIQYLAVHDYTSVAQNAKPTSPRETMMARPAEFEANYRHMADLLRQVVPDSHVRLIVNEWNMFYDATTIQSMEGAVYASRMMNGFERDGDIVEANSISDLLNGWVGGILQASRDRVYGTAQFYAVQMYSTHVGTERLAATVTSPALATGIQAVDAVVTRGADGSKIYIKLSNADSAHAVEVKVDVVAARLAQRGDLQILQAANTTARNSFENPQQIVPKHTTVRCSGGCTFHMPSNSVGVLTLNALRR